MFNKNKNLFVVWIISNTILRKRKFREQMNLFLILIYKAFLDLNVV